MSPVQFGNFYTKTVLKQINKLQVQLNIQLVLEEKIPNYSATTMIIVEAKIKSQRIVEY
jgi:hypothetical protein